MNLTWFIIRGSGIAAFALLSASMIWGLMVSGKMLGRAVRAKGLQWLHESLGLAAVVSTAIHMIALSMDEFIDFTWFDILVPGVSTWEPLAVTLGVVSFWTLVAVSFSFYIKKWIGQAAWRSLHYLSFGAFAAALAHLIHDLFAAPPSQREQRKRVGVDHVGGDVAERGAVLTGLGPIGARTIRAQVAAVGQHEIADRGRHLSGQECGCVTGPRHDRVEHVVPFAVGQHPKMQ